MENTLLIDLLITFNKKELREWVLFVQSPFFNQREDLTEIAEKLVDKLLKKAPLPTKPQLFSQIYPQKDYDDHKLRLAISALLKLAEKYLTHNATFESNSYVKIKLAEQYRLRNLPKHFDRTIRVVNKQLESQSFRNADFFHSQYQLQQEAYRFLVTRQRTGDFNLQEISNNLDFSYIISKLKQACFSLSHQAVYKTEYDFGLLKQVIVYIEQKGLLDIPAIAVYYNAYFTLSREGESVHFNLFKDLILDKADQFNPFEIRDLFLLAINHCTRKYNEGNRNFLRTAFELYKVGLEREYLIHNGVLSRFTYRNAFTLGLILKEYEWLAHFLFAYKSKLEKAYQESMFSFCLARLEYTRKNYTDALTLLRKSEYKDLLLNLSAKTIMMKILYELDEFDVLDAHLEAMKSFLRRKKVMGYHKDNYHNIIRFTRKLLEIGPYNKQEFQQLAEDIKQTKALAERTWLLQQLEKESRKR